MFTHDGFVAGAGTAADGSYAVHVVALGTADERRLQLAPLAGPDGHIAVNGSVSASNPG